MNFHIKLVYALNNVKNLNSDEIDILFLHKEKFWKENLVTQHLGLDGTHN